ncbi:uncharacterized protein LOC120333183 [Styela clava]|uniref:ephrin-B2a-like n=1 Tax=Styela clava TaxID=7725 RepID=UPI00193A00B1|nr:ephrin-B2a-like [Styela clava]
MDLTFAALIVVLFAGFQHQVSSFTFDEEAKRHYIYWDPVITKIIKDPNYSLQVQMGHFMDIVCPLSNLGITDNPEPPALFDLYNVTKEGFDTCNPLGGRLIFACSLPDQENKLTIKFQSISPSPFGFRFQECQEYYFLAVKRSSPLDKASGKKHYKCTKDSERLRIRVGCSDEKDEIEKSEPKATVVPPTKKPTTSFIDRIKENHNEKESKKEHKPTPVVPEIVPVTPTSLNSGKNLAIAASRSTNGDGGNGASNLSLSLFSTLFFTILSMLWISIINSSS